MKCSNCGKSLEPDKRFYVGLHWDGKDYCYRPCGIVFILNKL